MANAFSVIEAEHLLLHTSGFISLEHLVSCDPFINFPEHSHPCSNKPLPLIVPSNFSFVIFPKAYLLLSLNEVVSASAHFLPLLSLVTMKTSAFAFIPSKKWLYLKAARNKTRRWAWHKTKSAQKFPVGI